MDEKKSGNKIVSNKNIRSCDKPSKRSVDQMRERKGRKEWRDKPLTRDYPNPNRNDWRWYAPSEEIAKQVGNLPFNVLSGNPFTISAAGQIASSDDTTGKDYAMSSLLMRPASMLGANIKYVPSVGITRSANDAINMAANQLYTYIRKSNSGAKVYESPDLFMNILALIDIVRQMSEVRRALQFANYFNFVNKYMPKGLYDKLFSINYDDTIANKAQLCARYNVLVSKFNSFALPAYFKILARVLYVSTNVFMDSDSSFGQYYAFNAAGYYTYDPTDDSGSTLKWTTQSASDLGQRMDQIDSQINALFYDTDAQTMYGDILKAFGSAGIFQMAQISVDDVIQPVYDEDILAQIENATISSFVQDIINSPNAKESLNVTQNLQTHTIVFEPTLPGSEADRGTIFLQDRIFNSHKREPDYRDVLEWSRLCTTAEVSSSNIKVTSSGAEIVCDMITSFYQFDSSSSTVGASTYSGEVGWIDYRVRQFLTISFEKTNNSGIGHVGTSGEYWSALGADLMLSQCDWHPICYVLFHSIADEHPGTGGYGSQMIVVGDLKTATQLTEEAIVALNDVSMYALYYDADFSVNKY